MSTRDEIFELRRQLQEEASERRRSETQKAEAERRQKEAEQAAREKHSQDARRAVEEVAQRIFDQFLPYAQTHSHRLTLKSIDKPYTKHEVILTLDQNLPLHLKPGIGSGRLSLVFTFDHLDFDRKPSYLPCVRVQASVSEYNAYIGTRWSGDGACGQEVSYTYRGWKEREAVQLKKEAEVIPFLKLKLAEFLNSMPEPRLKFPFVS